MQTNSCQDKNNRSVGVTAPSPSPSTASAKPAASPDKNTRTSLANGMWGGEHILLTVSSKGAEVELDCAHGDIEEQIHLDAEGKFTVTGTFVTEGGPMRMPVDGAPEKPLRVTYRGRVQGEKLTLAIINDESKSTIDEMQLVYGRQSQLTKCY